jgi:hypothetical protein
MIRFVVFSIALTVPLALPAKDLPVPTATALEEPLALIKEVYGDEHSNAKTNEQLRALSTKLFSVGSKTENPIERYALLRIARDIATQGSDGQTAFQVIDAMDTTFQIDAVTMKASVLYSLAKKARLASDHKSIADQALDLVVLAVARDDFETAGKLVEMALSEARKLRDTDYIKSVVARSKEIGELSRSYKQVKAAAEKLEENPADPEANLAVGSYCCLVKGDWDNGLPMLALGSDAVLKDLALKELGQVTKPDEQIELGDGWWDLAEEEEGTERQQLRERARYWYLRAFPRSTGLVKVKLARRLEGVEARPRRYLSLDRVMETFQLPNTDWTIERGVLIGEVGSSGTRRDVVWFRSQPIAAAAVEFEFKVKAKWYHMISIEIDGREYSYSRGHWQNRGTYTKVDGSVLGQKMTGPIVTDPDEWAEVRAVLRENTVSIYYNKEAVVRQALPSKERHQVVLGFGCWRTKMEVKDFQIQMR